MTFSECLQAAMQQLHAFVDDPRLEAEILLAHVLQKPRSYLVAWPEKEITHDAVQKFQTLINRRCQQEPIAYLIGHREFWSLDFFVTPDTLIPRPETELLIETILSVIPTTLSTNPTTPTATSAAPTATSTAPTVIPAKAGIHPTKLADLGTGSGAIAIAIASERPHWQIHATDQSEAVLTIARTNAKRLNLHNIIFNQGNWCDALPCKDFDIIVSNPPYLSEVEWPQYAAQLSFEPRIALVSGPDGLDALRAIIQTAPSYLRPGGILLVEHGFQQGEAVRNLLKISHFAHVKTLLDFAGCERVTMGQI